MCNVLYRRPCLGSVPLATVLPLACIFLLSCSKSHNAPATGPTVYIAGDNGTYPVLWKNSSPEVLSDSAGFATQVTLSGNDVYVAGGGDVNYNADPAGTVGRYVYWKNGVQDDLSQTTVLNFPCAIAVAGNNVYFASYAFYQNGIPDSLPGEGLSGKVDAMLTVGNDLYIAGLDSLGDAVYWKNGVMNVVTNDFSSPVYCLAVSGTDVYIGGSDALNHAAYWKNGVKTVLQASAYATSVWYLFVDGMDVYAVGNLVVNGANAPAYWKNGVQVNLPLNGASYGNAASIFVSGGDVYIVGYTSQGAVFWKNGVETILSPQGTARSIIVH
jgi:hypothetical protein